MDFSNNNTICAPASSIGSGAIALIRLSGKETQDIIHKIFNPVKSFRENPLESRKVRFGTIRNEQNEVVDEVLLYFFQAPNSYTGEDMAEISCHGSNYIVQEILRLMLHNGAMMAEPGEFTQRAFLNGKMDLIQAEAVADLIASDTYASHKIALQQMRGGFSNQLQEMRDALLQLVSLMELELDFSEEDIEFADRTQLNDLLDKTKIHISKLIESFKLGNVIKNGVPVAIAGATNTGKSTLLNQLLGEERAIVSNIHGTTRDSIEDTVNIGGHTFRFIDTAGIRNATETIEIIGIERTFSKIKQASIIILVLDAERSNAFKESIENLYNKINPEEQQIIILLNKTDEIKQEQITQYINEINLITSTISLSPVLTYPISAKHGVGLDKLAETLTNTQQDLQLTESGTLVSNMRHYEALKSANEALSRVQTGLKSQIPTDLLTQDMREAIRHIGTITGEINTEEVLGNIFGKFCIGK